MWPSVRISRNRLAENHQFHNAKALENKNAAVVVTEKELKDDFDIAFKGLMDKKKQKEIIQNLSQFAKPNAAKEIVNHIEGLI